MISLTIIPVVEQQVFLDDKVFALCYKISFKDYGAFEVLGSALARALGASSLPLAVFPSGMLMSRSSETP